MTNYEKFKNLTVDELAWFLVGTGICVGEILPTVVSDKCPIQSVQYRGPCVACKKCWKEYLLSDVSINESELAKKAGFLPQINISMAEKEKELKCDFLHIYGFLEMDGPHCMLGRHTCENCEYLKSND